MNFTCRRSRPDRSRGPATHAALWLAVTRKRWMSWCVSVLLAVLLGDSVIGAETRLKTENVFLITADGLRWQEVFTGAEELLMNKENGGVGNTNTLRRDFWRDTPEARREALLPFFWSEVARRGQIYGNGARNSPARVTNGRNFSYPGYSELLTGRADARIDSNDKKPNPNVTVLEWVHQRPEFKGKVAAFCCWDVFPFIINRERAGFPVKAGWEMVDEANPARESLNRVLRDAPRVWDSVIYDAFMFHEAMDYIRERQPRLVYLAFGETDDWAHDGRYDFYLRGARGFDRSMQRLWETLQSMPAYRDKTTLILTTDHGRGTGPVAWKNHGQNIPESAFTWVAVWGPDTPARGERSDTPLVTQTQIAATVAALLNADYRGAFSDVGELMRDVLPEGFAPAAQR